MTASPATPQKRVVLVVDDEVLIRMAAAGLVEDAGFEAIEADGADAAIRILESRPDIHLVFTDIDMPGSMDGLKLAHFVQRRWPPVKLIVVSGKALLAKMSLPPGSRFFAKPYSDQVIAEAMAEMLAA